MCLHHNIPKYFTWCCSVPLLNTLHHIHMVHFSQCYSHTSASLPRVEAGASHYWTIPALPWFPTPSTPNSRKQGAVLGSHGLSRMGPGSTTAFPAPNKSSLSSLLYLHIMCVYFCNIYNYINIKNVYFVDVL